MWVELVILIFTLISLGFLYFHLAQRRHAAFWSSKNIPFVQKGTTWSELLTWKKTMFDQNYYAELKKIGAKFGGVYEQGSHALFVNDPDLLRAVFVKDFDHFEDRRDVKTTDPMMSKMLVALHGQEWKAMRSFLSPTFTSGKLRRMFAQFNSSGKRLETHVGNIPVNPETGCHVVTIPELARRFTVDVIGATVFGIETGALSEPDPIFYRLATRAVKPSKFLIMKFLVFIFAPKIATLLKIKAFDAEVINYFKGILSTALKQREASKEKRDDFLQLMVEARHEGKGEKSENGDKTAMSMSDDSIMAQCFLFFFAGFDTVANLVSLSCYVLAVNPELQEKVRENVEAAVESTGGEVTYDSASKMDYLDMFIAETQRMYQSQPRLERKCTKAWKVPGSDFVVPSGMIVMTDPEAFHFDPAYYPNPEQFDVERFSPENKAKRNPYVYLPFGLGPRNCIGMRFGLIEAKVAIAHLVKTFEILPTPKTPIPIKMDRVFSVSKAPADLEICLKFRSKQE
ncbi:cytochrome P450 9e2 [Folsomia candida]|uniref:Cytochrome P450 9e2 n=1 Tax=Folsomia candida TaxID=158441 RepID=A0A226E0P8_FOLCA|nr:cytochrome P450 9e2 [Folsomia candida]OXA51325.1 Cytochrome P450 9e2 [Folsomia candida]